MSPTSFPERRARRRLASFLDEAPLPASSIETHFEYGDPANQISKFVHNNEIDLLVFPAKSRAAPFSSSLGPVADRVLRRVTCPLFLVRPDRPSLHDTTDANMASSEEKDE
jgi:nucleotide-binding universal stress UspA family protein